jgi:heptosyltransferase-2
MANSFKVLIIQTAFLGDAILATSLLEKIRIEAPETQIHLLVRKGNESIFQAYDYGNLAKVWSYDKKNKFRNWLELRKKLSVENFDKVFIVQRFFGMGLLSLCIGAKMVIGFNKNPLSMFFTKKIPHHFGNGDHEIKRNTSLLVDWLGEKVYKPYLNPPKMELPVGLKTKEYICISPGSVWETKRFPIHKWIEFIRLLPENQSIVLMGAPKEKELSNQIEQAFQGSLRPIFNETGKHPLLASTYIFQQSKKSYVNDSGPMHICSAVNVPTVAIFCSTIPAFGFGPLADDSTIIEASEILACRPCGDHGKIHCPLGHFKCGNDIDVKRMYDV